MRLGPMLVVVASAAALVAQDSHDGTRDEHVWKNVVYLGGVPGVRVDRRDLEQSLHLTRSNLILTVEPTMPVQVPGRPKPPSTVLFDIPRDAITAITYAGFRRDNIAAQSWIGIPRRWPKSTDHLLVIDFRRRDGGEAEVLLRVDRKHFQEILDVLQNKDPSSRDGGRGPS